MNAENFTVDEILAAFDFNDGIYPREMVDAAIERQSQIAPRLIDILKQVIADPTPYAENEDRFSHIYALMLLGHFKAAESHQTIIDLFSLPEKTVDSIYGDIITTNLPMILLNTCGGSVEAIRAMATNRSVGDYERISAIQAIVWAMVDGWISREGVIDLLGSLLNEDEAQQGSEFWGLLANLACDIYPEENMPAIEKAYKDGLISPGMIPFEAFELALADNKEAVLADLREEREAAAIDDLHAEMSRWACFESGEELFAPAGPADLFASDSYAPSVSKSRKAEKKKQKRKRKQANASKRRNRR